MNKKKVSHAAAAFILQKSNEVLSMIKAFKRKSNNNANAATATATTPNDAMKSSSAATTTTMTTPSSQTKHSSAVNCMQFSLNDESVSFCDNFDASNCNIYTEIDLCNALPTKDLVIEPTKSTSSCESLSSDILCFLFNNTNDLLIPHDHNQSEDSHINSYVNETVTSQAITQMEINVTNADCANEQNLYDIGSGAQYAQSSQQSEQSVAFNSQENSLKSNAFFTNISKSLKNKLKLVQTEDDDLDESTDVTLNTADRAELPKHIVDKNSLRNRLKFKFKSGFNFFKDIKVRFPSMYR